MKGLGKLVKKREGKVNFQLAPYIDKALTDVRESFSLRKIHSTVTDLEQVLQGEGTAEEKTQKVFSLFFKLQDLVYAPAIRAGAKIHPSSLMSACERAVYYELIRAPFEEAAVTVGPQLQRIFDVGTWWHTYIQNALEKVGILKEREAAVVDPKRKINGRADGILHIEGSDVLLEIKTMNGFQFSKLNRPLEHHEYQASLYADILGIDNILYLYVNKDSCELKEFYIKKNNALVNEANEKIYLILDAVSFLAPPDRICSSKISKQALSCGYCNHCFTEPIKSTK
jgi:hypothetical protein